jgi:hypothetical protein
LHRKCLLVTHNVISPLKIDALRHLRDLSSLTMLS